MQENLQYLVSASPPAQALKRLVCYSGRASTEDDANPGTLPDGSLLQPQKQDLAVLPPGRPILVVMVDAEAEFDWDGPFLRTLVSVRNLSRQVMYTISSIV